MAICDYKGHLGRGLARVSVKMTDPAPSLHTASIPEVVCVPTPGGAPARGRGAGAERHRREGGVREEDLPGRAKASLPQRKPPAQRLQTWTATALSLTDRPAALCACSIFLRSQNPF